MKCAAIVVVAVLAAVLANAGAATAAQAVTVELDASQAARGIAYVHERIPASAGPLTLVYPKWIPGEHGPTGPLNDLAALRISAGGNALDWRRDAVDLYAFHVVVPPGAGAIDVDFDVLLNGPNDTMSTRSVLIVNWNRALLYRLGAAAHDYAVKPSIRLPSGWEYATALRDPVTTGDRTDFAVTTLETLIDSPLDAGRFVKKWNLWKDGAAFVQLAAFADAPQDLDAPPAVVDAYRRLPAETFAMYGSRHFADYHALLTLSDAIGGQGIEHHQSSDDRGNDDFLTNPAEALDGGDLIPHELSHSWNGKYRRPADLATPDFQTPMRTDLLWVYEGMNQYIGDVLSFRCGIRDPKLFPDYVAAQYADMDNEPGRATTPIIDVATGAPYYYVAGGAYPSIRRRSDDFYVEGFLIWLDVDTILRGRSHGSRTLDTFLHRFTEPAVTAPMVVTYNRDAVESLLGNIEPYDWHGLFEKTVYHPAAHPPIDDLARAGWKLVYDAKPNVFVKAHEALHDDSITGWYEYGANLSAKGTILDVRQGSPAWKAGLVPGMLVVAVNGQQFSPDVLAYALDTAVGSSSPLSLIVSQTGWYQTLALDYHAGPRFPHLERIEGTPDMLAAIAAPHVK